MTLKRNVTQVCLIGLTMIGGIIQSCLLNTDSKRHDAIVPGLYKGTDKDGFAIYYFKLDSIGSLDFRQCDPDSTVRFQSISTLSFKNDSAYFSERRTRTYSYFDNSRTSGEWSEWKERESTRGKRDSTFSEILSDKVTARLGDEWVLFKRLGPTSSTWPKSRNDIQE